MRAGKLQNKIELQEKQTQKNPVGENTVNWVTFATVWARIRPLLGKEFFNAAQVQAEVTHKINIRFTEKTDAAGRTLSPIHRVKLGDRVFDINSVLNANEADAEMVLMCKESTAP
jgi:SPP1 family predicted phage head-tail adaptor